MRLRWRYVTEAMQAVHRRARALSRERLAGRASLLALGLVLGVALTSCSEQSPSEPQDKPDGTPGGFPPIRFADVTAESGLDLTLTCGRTPLSQLPETKGGGLALIDYDNDGDLDVFVPNGAYLDALESGPGCRMFENLGGMKFRDVTTDLGLDFRRWGMGVTVGDVDADGFDDLYVAAFGTDALLRNEGGKRFREITADAGLGDARWSTAAAFADLDTDGDLDLYVVNYIQFDVAHPPPPEKFKEMTVFAGPVGKPCDPDVLYENDGKGHFRDVSEASGIHAVKPSAGLGVVIVDFDGDGKQDIFVGNDSMSGFLFMNQGGLEFTDQAARAGLALNGDGQAQATMGIAIGDVNGDGRPDVFTTNFSSDTNTLRVSSKKGFFFEDRTSQYGLGQVSRPFLGWATGFYDFNCDGVEDLVVFNGHVWPNATIATADSTFEQVPLLFHRDVGSTRFLRDESSTAGDWLAQAHRDRSASFGDLDGDGGVDILVGGVNQKIRLLRCTLGENAAWLTVELLDERPGIGNRHALGAKIVLSARQSRPDPRLPAQTRWIVSGGSYQATSQPWAHFGYLGSADLDITWPDGTQQKLEKVEPSRHLVVRRK